MSWPNPARLTRSVEEASHCIGICNVMSSTQSAEMWLGSCTYEYRIFLIFVNICLLRYLTPHDTSSHSVTGGTQGSRVDSDPAI